MHYLIVFLTIVINFKAYANQQVFIADQITSVQLKKEGLLDNGKISKALSYKDKSGTYIFIARQYDISLKSKSVNQIFEHEIKATLYKKVENQWVEQWVIRDGVNCPDLDYKVDFFTQQISATDIDHNGYTELTIPYNLFCGGDIDPSTIKIIFMNNGQKFAIRGHSLVLIKGEAPYGGNKTIDASLNNSKNLIFKEHLLTVWNSIYIQKSY